MAYHIQEDLIRQLRGEMRDRQVAQTALANDVGISRKHLHLVLAGKAQASVDLWQRLLDAVTRYERVVDGDSPYEGLFREPGQ